MYHFSMDVILDSDGIVLSSLAVTCLTLKSGSWSTKATALVTCLIYWQNAANIPFWH